MHIKRQYLQKIPTVFVYNNDITEASQKGTILFFHGLGASKDAQIHDLKNLAKSGFLVVGVDNVGHGERRYLDFEQKFSVQNPDLERDFQQAVLETAQEVPIIIEELEKKELIFNGNIGITGISMGGFVTYRAVIEYAHFKAAVSILGSPKWKNNDSHSPHLYMQKFAPTALMSLNAGKDTSVPAFEAKNFHGELAEYYTEINKLEYIEYPDSEHFMLENDWNDLWNNMTKWFSKWLVT
ncbi:alpha/beta hydrolase family protein [Candidatus Uabimicrobium sp. HlEnr_7]|uniref:alpha/beta hydrolase family protein n=1 Tax=Candidatus Uabimicrobium helgolandensis TaxID=3095367 RepID=UPI003555C776